MKDNLKMIKNTIGDKDEIKYEGIWENHELVKKI